MPHYKVNLPHPPWCCSICHKAWVTQYNAQVCEDSHMQSQVIDNIIYPEIKRRNCMPLPKIEALQRSFEFGERKTLKLKVKQSTNLIDAIHSAREFLADNLEYSRIEFAYDKMYYVIARLKEKE